MSLRATAPGVADPSDATECYAPVGLDGGGSEAPISLNK